MSDPLTECKRYLTKAPCAIFSGQTQMIVVVGVSLRVELGTPLGRIYQRLSTIIMV
jgi:hypothetical protein